MSAEHVPGLGGCTPVRVGAGPYNRSMPPFRIASDFQPAGDQPAAIDR